jgi:hypothetical protein
MITLGLGKFNIGITAAKTTFGENIAEVVFKVDNTHGSGLSCVLEKTGDEIKVLSISLDGTERTSVVDSILSLLDDWIEFPDCHRTHEWSLAFGSYQKAVTEKLIAAITEWNNQCSKNDSVRMSL